MKLALPIMGGMVSQNVMNLVDTGMVGSQGKAALAAVGMSSFATFVSQAFREWAPETSCSQLCTRTSNPAYRRPCTRR